MDIFNEEKLKLLRAYLNRDGVKLWMEPYTSSSSDQPNYPEDLLAKYQKEVYMSRDELVAHLENLRAKALQNIQTREEFQRTGLASLKVKVIANEKQVQLSLKIPLTSTAAELKDEILKNTECPPSSGYLKLISSGKVLQDIHSLEEQGIKNQSQMLALFILDSHRAGMEAAEKQRLSVEETKEAASYLSSVNGDDELTITDQNGKVLQYSSEDKKNLCMALATYDKGKESLEKKNLSDALVFFMEADNLFTFIDPNLLSMVDNYGLLCLDIAWCYLKLNNLELLPDAESRLQTCEDSFRKSYGTNLERLKAIKGDDTKEQALFTRLYLLKGIVAFHKSELDQAKFWLRLAQDNLGQIKVDHDSLVQVMGMGYSLAESRLALRKTRGDISQAVEHILQERKSQERIRRENEARDAQEKLEKMLGKTLDGSKVDTGLYQVLLNMGFKKEDISKALKIANNQLESAIQMLSSGNIEQLASQHNLVSNGASTSVAPKPSQADIQEYQNKLNLPYHVEQHLDLALDEEEAYIQQYQQLIESLSYPGQSSSTLPGQQ